MFIKQLIVKKHFKRCRAQLKGARLLYKENHPNIVGQVVSDLTDVHIGLTENNFPGSLVGSHGSQAEILLHQILVENYRRICSLIMQSKGSGEPASLLVPNSSINSLISNGIQIN